MSLQDAAQQALEALESLQGGCTDSDDGTVETITVWCPEVIDALRTALAENKRDWSLLEATQESLREHMAEIQTLRAALAQPASVEPVAFMWQHDETGRCGFVEAHFDRAHWQEHNPRLAIVSPLYTSSMVGELRAKTDAPMMECKKALTEADGDMVRAEEILRVKLGNKAPLAQRQPLTNGQIHTAYIEAADQTLRPQDERIAFAFARAIEAAHGIKEQP